MKPTQEQVIAWAREAGATVSLFELDGQPSDYYRIYERFATLAYEAGYEAGRKDENEACAKVCEAGTGEPIQMKTLEILRKERERIAAAIRARMNPLQRMNDAAEANGEGL